MSTGVPKASLRVVGTPSPEERVQAFAESHRIPLGDKASILQAVLDADAAEVYTALLEESAALMPLVAQLGRIVAHDATKCLTLLWPKRLSGPQFLLASLPSRPCTKWVVPKCTDAEITDVIRTLATRFAFHGEARSPGWTAQLLYAIHGRGSSLPPDVADNLFRVYSSDDTKVVRDAVVDVLARRGSHQHEPSPTPCTICHDTAFEHVRIFTARADGATIDAGEVCFACFQKSTVLRNTVFGQTSVFETNTSGQTMFMMNRQRVEYVLLRGRLYTYAAFVARFNQHGIGARLRLASVRRLRPSNR